MAANEIKIIIGGDASPMIQASQQSVAAVKDLQNSIAVASAKIDNAAESIRLSFDEIGAGQAAMDKIAASIDAMADAALKAGPKFDTLGGRLPLQDFNEFRSSIERLKKDISSGLKVKVESQSLIPPIPPSVPDSFNKTKVGANQAAVALTNVGRVAQDLPFGFVGIQNNLNPLLESFQRLKAETGSSGAAFKALGSSLIGAGGIGLALSLVSSAIVIFQNGIAGFNSKTKEAKAAADELAKSIRSIGLIQGEAAAGVEGQISQVAALAAAVADSNRPYEQRKRALEELKDINKAYFGDLKLEDAATGALTKTVDEYTKALINSAITKGFVDEIATIAKEVSKSDEIIRKSRLKVAQTTEETNRLEKLLAETRKGPQVQTGFQDTRVITARKAQAQAENELSAANEKSTKLLEQEAVLRDNLNKAVAEGLKFKDLDTDKTKKEEDALKKRLEALEKIKAATKDATALVGIQESIFELQVKIAIRDQGKNKLSKSELDQQIQGFNKELQDAFNKQAIELEAIPKVRFSDVKRAEISFEEIQSKIAKATGLDKKIPIKTQFEVEALFNGKEFAEKAELVRQQVAAVIDTLARGIQDAIIQGSEVIGAAFAGLFNGEGVGSALAKAAQGLLGIVGGVLQEVGKQIIITSNLVKILKQAIGKLFGPGGEAIGLAVGATLIATGALLKNIKFDVPKLAQGGIATGPTLGIFGEAGKEAIIPLDRLPDLIGKLNVNNTANVVLNGNLRISGTDLALALEKVDNRRRRLG